MKKAGLIFNTLIVSLGELGIKILGLARDILIAGFFGASSQLDAFFVALNVPTIFISILGSALTTAFIPVYFRYREKKEKDEMAQFLANLTTCVVILFAVLALTVFLLAAPLVKLMAPGFLPEQAGMAAALVKALAIMTFLTGLGVYLKAPAQCENRYGWAVASDLTNNGVVLLLVMLLAPFLGINGLVHAFIFGAACQALILALRYFKDKGRITARFSFLEPGLLEVFYLSLPLYVGMLTANISIIVDRAMASGLPGGSISALTYADKIRNLPVTIFGTALVTVLFPALSRLVTLAKEEEVNNLLDRVSKFSIMAGFYIVSMIWLLAVPLVAFLFERGNFTREATLMTAEALRYFALGIPAVVLGTVCMRVYHAHQDTRTPVKLGLISVTVNIVLNFMLIGSMAHRGIALATSTANWTWLILLAVFLRSRLGVSVYTHRNKMLIFLVKAAVANLAAFVSVNTCLSLLSGHISETVLLFIALFAGAVCFTAVALLCGIDKSLGIENLRRKTI